MAPRTLSLNCKHCKDKIECMIKPGRWMFFCGYTIRVPCKVIKPLVVHVVHKLAQNSSWYVDGKAEITPELIKHVTKQLDIAPLTQLVRTQFPPAKLTQDADSIISRKVGLFHRLNSMYDVTGKALRRRRYLEKKSQELAKVWAGWLNDEL